MSSRKSAPSAKSPASDAALGMGRPIARRDFLQGVAALGVAGAVGPVACAGSSPHLPGAVGTDGLPAAAAVSPPARLGLRGSHEGAFEVAHEMAFDKRSDWGPVEAVEDGVYDLVVVGAGVSGLAAAFFARERDPNARILLLENHDDFGGHAKRNEFAWQDRTILGYGGSQSLEAPSAYSDTAKGLLARLGVEPRRLADAYDQEFYRRHGLGAGVFFDAEHYGVDRFVRTDLIDPRLFVPTARDERPLEASIAEMPISEAARGELRRLVEGGPDRLPEQSIFSEPEFLHGISYRRFLTEHLGVTDPEVLALLQEAPAIYFGHGIDAIPALEAMGFGLPGLGHTSLGSVEGLLRRAIDWSTEPYVYHFPDGNASIARLLVRALIDGVAPGSTMDDVVTARFDYAALDRPGAPVRLRLGSTVVRVAHDGDPATASEVVVHLRRAGRTEGVRAKRVILAGYNMAIPYLCPELPEAQKGALSQLVKIPLVYSTVLLRNWEPFVKQRLGLAHCPGSWHTLAMLDFPVSLGDYRFASDPKEPAVVHLSNSLARNGATPQDQSRAGRYELLGTSFETIERRIRVQLAGMLSGTGFDPAADIEAITVNRWPHGYAFTTNPLFDGDDAEGEAPWEMGRARFGRIAIANSDAGGRAYLDEAIDQGFRAVTELFDG